MSHSPETHPDRPSPWYRRGLQPVRRCLIYYLVFVLGISLMQRWLIYVPTTSDRLPVQLSGCLPGGGEDISLQTSEGLQLHGWHLLPSALSAGSAEDFDRFLADGRQVLIYFPGNGGNRSSRSLDFQLLSRLQLHVFAFDYRGYGENRGNPSEANFAADAEAIWKYVTATRYVAPDRIILFGESLGGGVATHLATDLCVRKTPPAGLILRSTFNSMVAAAEIHQPFLPVSWILKDRYRSDLKIPQLTAPLLMMHGARDTIVPYTLGQQLFALAPERSSSGVAKKFVELPLSDHNDASDRDPQVIESAIKDFLTQVRILDQPQNGEGDSER